MSNELANIDNQSLFNLITNGDCSKLSPDQKLQYYKARCDAAGLDPRCQPFQFIKLQGREVLYALKSGTDQLASKHGVICEVLNQVTENGIRTVTVRAKTADGRQTDEIGCVTVEGLKGDQLCNAQMKALTKAKRRAVLSICGLGMLDETEIETIPNVQTINEAPLTLPVKDTIQDESHAESPKTKAAKAKSKEKYTNGKWKDLVMHFGIHKGKTLGQIYEDDISYLSGWMRESWLPKKRQEYKEKGFIAADDLELAEAMSAYSDFREEENKKIQVDQTDAEFDKEWLGDKEVA
jgi:hypothetical protein